MKVDKAEYSPLEAAQLVHSKSLANPTVTGPKPEMAEYYQRLSTLRKPASEREADKLHKELLVLATFVREMAMLMVETPADIRVLTHTQGNTHRFIIHANESDISRLVGKGRSTYMSMRRLLQTAASTKRILADLQISGSLYADRKENPEHKP